MNSDAAESAEPIKLDKWPPLSIGYTIAGQEPAIELSLSMQSSRYVPSPGEAVKEVLALIDADRENYRTTLLHLARPDLSVALSTTLDADSMKGSPYALDVAPFKSFMQEACRYLDAHALMKPVTATAEDGAVQQIASAYGLTLGQLLAANQHQSYAALFGTALLRVPAIYTMVKGDTLATMAKRTTGLTVSMLAMDNAEAPLRPGAELISRAATAPAKNALSSPDTSDSVSVNTLRAADGDTLQSLAKEAGINVAALAALNADCPDLWPVGTALHAGLRAPVQPADKDTLAEFAAKNQLTIEQLGAANAASETPLTAGAVLTIPGALDASELLDHSLASSGRWQLMRSDSDAKNPSGTLSGLAAAHETDVLTLALSNAATLGLLAPGVELPLANPAIKTGRFDTFNAIVNRLMQQGVPATVPEVAAALANLPGLVAPDAVVAPVPPPSPASLMVKLKPTFATAAFQLEVSVTLSLDPKVADPDTKELPTSAVLVALPQSDVADTLSFDDFATAFETALPGVKVATSAKVSCDTASVDNTFWCINFDHPQGPKIAYQFDGANTDYFAVPPLSTHLVGGQVPIIPYVSGKGLSGTPQLQMFQSIDLQAWLETFLQAFDQLQAKACALPTETATLLTAYRTKLASALSQRVQPILAGGKGSLGDAQVAMSQALLTELSAACTGNALVQVPVKTSDGGSNPTLAPRLFIEVTATSTAPTESSIAFSVSDTEVTLSDPASTAIFLFKTASPAQNRSIHINVDCTVTALELPDSDSTIDGIPTATRLGFIKPLSHLRSAIGTIVVPIPLKDYPRPIPQIFQHAWQSVRVPLAASDVLQWDFEFRHAQPDAEQDTSIITARLDDPLQPTLLDVQEAPPAALNGVFEALAQFIAVYPELQGDLAPLSVTATKQITETPLAAARAFTQLAGGVAKALVPASDEKLVPHQSGAYAFQIQKERDAAGDLYRLAVICVDPATGAQTANGLNIWPSVYTTIDGVETLLSPDGKPEPGATQTFYAYPKGIPANTALAQRFVFAGPTAHSPEPGNSPPTQPMNTAHAVAGATQTFVFTGLHPLACPSASAGVAVVRNLSLVRGVSTNPAFVFRTPVSHSPAISAPLCRASSPIEIRLPPPQDLATSLSAFFDALLGAPPAPWQADRALIAKLMASFVYDSGGGLNVDLPIALLPEIRCDPKAVGGWALEPGAISQFASSVEAWRAETQPSTLGAFYRVEIDILQSAAADGLRVQVTDLRYRLT